MIDEYLLVTLAVLFLCDCITTHQILKRGGKELNGFLAKVMSWTGVDEALGLSKVIVFVFIAAMYYGGLFGEHATLFLTSANLAYAVLFAWNGIQWFKGTRP